MANINLISARRAERVRLTKVARGLMLATLGLGVVGLLGMGFIAMQTFRTHQRVQTARVELQRLAPLIRQIEADQAERDALRPKLDTLLHAQEKTQWWLGMLGCLQRSVPENTWLTGLSVDRTGGKAGALRLNGVSTSQARVGETMYRLAQERDYYERIDLQFTQTSQTPQVERVEFELRASLKLPQAPTASKDKQGKGSDAN